MRCVLPKTNRAEPNRGGGFQVFQRLGHRVTATFPPPPPRSGRSWSGVRVASGRPPLPASPGCDVTGVITHCSRGRGAAARTPAVRAVPSRLAMTDRNFYIRLAGIGRAVYHFPSMNAAGRAGHAVARRQRGGDHSLLLPALGRHGQGQARIFHFYVVFFRISLFPSVVRANRKHRGATERRDAAVRAIRPEGARLAAWRPAGSAGGDALRRPTADGDVTGGHCRGVRGKVSAVAGQARVSKVGPD